MRKIILTFTLTLLVTLSCVGVVFADNTYVIDGNTSEWEGSKYTDVTYNPTDCLYHATAVVVGDSLYGHIYTYGARNIRDTVEGLSISHLKIDFFKDGTESERVWQMYLLQVSEDGSIKMSDTSLSQWANPHIDLTKDGTYKFVLSSKYGWKTATNLSELGTNDFYCGEAVITINGDKYELEYRVDLNGVVNAYNAVYYTNKTLDDIHTIKIKHHRCGDQAIIIDGTPTGVVGVIACASVAIGSYYFVDKKRKLH